MFDIPFEELMKMMGPGSMMNGAGAPSAGGMGMPDFANAGAPKPPDLSLPGGPDPSQDPNQWGTTLQRAGSEGVEPARGPFQLADMSSAVKQNLQNPEVGKAMGDQWKKSMEGMGEKAPAPIAGKPEASMQQAAEHQQQMGQQGMQSLMQMGRAGNLGSSPTMTAQGRASGASGPFQMTHDEGDPRQRRRPIWG